LGENIYGMHSRRQGIEDTAKETHIGMNLHLL
jgi:hypothetical protein